MKVKIRSASLKKKIALIKCQAIVFCCDNVLKLCHCHFFFLSAQQQANLIPGLNLNALGIFSSGLPVLPPAAGPRSAVPAVAPAGYNPFLVSILCFLWGGKAFLVPPPLFPQTTWAHGHKREEKVIFENASLSMTLPLLVYPHQVHDKDWLDKAIYLQHLVNQAPLKCIFKIHYSVDSGLPAWFCTQFEATRIPPSSPEMSQSVSKTKSPLIAWRARAKAAWDSAWECMCVLRSQDTQCVIHCEFLPWNSPRRKSLTCVRACAF